MTRYDGNGTHLARIIESGTAGMEGQNIRSCVKSNIRKL
jgi:hypothetical protein